MDLQTQTEAGRLTSRGQQTESLKKKKSKAGNPKKSKASEKLKAEAWAYDYNEYCWDYYQWLQDLELWDTWTHFYYFPWKFEGYGDYDRFSYPWAYNRSWDMWVWEVYDQDPWQLPPEAVWDPWEVSEDSGDTEEGRGDIWEAPERFLEAWEAQELPSWVWSSDDSSGT